MALKAFRVTCNGIGDGIYFSENASKAKVAALLAGREAGYSVEFRHLRVIRAPGFDRRTYLGKIPGQGICPEYFDRTD
jgi:hypothetical protein